MESRKTASWLLLFVGMVMLVVGAASSSAQDPIGAGAPSEYDDCVAKCNASPGIGRTPEQCVLDDCSIFVNCLNCPGCFNIGNKDTNECTTKDLPCGSAFGNEYCNNGICLCFQTAEVRAEGIYYRCKCKVS